MTTWIATSCGCTQEVSMGQKRAKVCEEHGNLFIRLGRPKLQRRPAKRSELKRDWTDARAKVDLEARCRICKRTDKPLEAAHVLGREHDEPKVNRATGEILKELYVDPDRVLPACGPFPEGCHGEVDLKKVDLLPHLTLEEQVRAVKDAGGIQHARTLLEPVTYNAEVRELAA